MKVLRRILFLIAAITIIIVSIGFLLPGKVHVERSLIIEASKNNIFNQVNTLKNWENWSPWIHLDPIMQLSYSGPKSGVGATYTWQSMDKNVGDGKITIIASVPYDSLVILMDYDEKGKTTAKFLFVKEVQGTKVTWSLDSDLGMNPLSRWIGVLSDQMIGPDLEKGLFNIDDLMNESKTFDGFEIIDIELPARVLLSIRDTASPGTVIPKLTLMYKKISRFLKIRNLSPTGPPFAVFHDYTSSNLDIEAGMPVESNVTVPEGLKCRATDAQKSVMVRYFGTRKLINGAYTALQNYIKYNGLQVTGSPWEEYITNPSLEADSNKWQTNIYYPIK